MFFFFLILGECYYVRSRSTDLLKRTCRIFFSLISLVGLLEKYKVKHWQGVILKFKQI